MRQVVCLDRPASVYKDFLAGEKIEEPRWNLVRKFDFIIGCDAVERGFEKIVTEKNKNQKIILLDHHTSLCG